MYAHSIGSVTETFIHQDALYLSKNHDLLFICDTITDSGNYPLYDRIKVVEESPFRLSILQRLALKLDIKMDYYNQSFAQTIKKTIETFKPDIIHCQFGIQALKLIDNLEDHSIPLVIQFRGHDASNLLHKKAYVKRLKEVLSRPNYHAIFVANSLRKNLKAKGIGVEGSMILHSGIDLTKFALSPSKPKDSSTPFTFLQVSSLEERKGIEYTLHAFAILLQSHPSKAFKLILTGDGERKASLVTLVEQLGLSELVEFVGFVSPLEAKALMQQADAFVHHSITTEDGNQEGIPNALMEAMAMELPVISTYHSGIPELVTDGVNGYLVKERDIQHYATRMADILSWKRMPLNREVIAKEFEINFHIKKLEDFYHRVSQKSVK